MIIKGRSPHKHHVYLMHCVNFYWLFERVNLDSNISNICEPAERRPFVTKGCFTRDKRDELMILFGIVSESHHSSPLSVVATLVLPAHQMAKRDEASKHTGASSKSKPVGKRVLALAAVRQDKSS